MYVLLPTYMYTNQEPMQNVCAAPHLASPTWSPGKMYVLLLTSIIHQTYLPPTWSPADVCAAPCTMYFSHLHTPQGSADGCAALTPSLFPIPKQQHATTSYVHHATVTTTSPLWSFPPPAFTSTSWPSWLAVCVNSCSPRKPAHAQVYILYLLIKLTKPQTTYYPTTCHTLTTTLYPPSVLPLRSLSGPSVHHSAR